MNRRARADMTVWTESKSIVGHKGISALGNEFMVRD
jgi:hypothetical protein